jgi:hypothetical protein
MLKTVRVHDSDQPSVEDSSVRRVVELASGQVRLDLDLDARAEMSRDVILPARHRLRRRQPGRLRDEPLLSCTVCTAGSEHESMGHADVAVAHWRGAASWSLRSHSLAFSLTWCRLKRPLVSSRSSLGYSARSENRASPPSRPAVDVIAAVTYWAHRLEAVGVTSVWRGVRGFDGIAGTAYVSSLLPIALDRQVVTRETIDRLDVEAG